VPAKIQPTVAFFDASRAVAAVVVAALGQPSHKVMVKARPTCRAASSRSWPGGRQVGVLAVKPRTTAKITTRARSASADLDHGGMAEERQDDLDGTATRMRMTLAGEPGGSRLGHEDQGAPTMR